MSEDVVKQMEALAEEGYTPESIWESIVYALGTAQRVNKATTAKEAHGDGTVSLPKGEVVTIEGVGGGESGADYHVRTKDGRQAIVHHYDLGESHLKKFSEEKSEESTDESLVGVVKKITLSKPLPQSAANWLQYGHVDMGVMLPEGPQSDSASSITFLMKAEGEESMEMALSSLKRAAGGSFKSASEATLTDWDKTY